MVLKVFPNRSGSVVPCSPSPLALSRSWGAAAGPELSSGSRAAAKPERPLRRSITTSKTQFRKGSEKRSALRRIWKVKNGGLEHEKVEQLLDLKSARYRDTGCDGKKEKCDFSV